MGILFWEIGRGIATIMLSVGAVIGWINGHDMTNYVQYNMVWIILCTVMIIEERQTKKKKNG